MPAPTATKITAAGASFSARPVLQPIAPRIGYNHLETRPRHIVAETLRFVNDSLHTYERYISRYTFPVASEQNRRSLEVIRTGDFTKDTWAIRKWDGDRLSRDHQFSHEPSNSSKTDEYILMHTFTLAEALPIAESLAHSQTPALMIEED